MPEQKQLTYKDDINFIIAAFPDIKNEPGFPEKADKRSMSVFIKNCMDQCNIKGNPDQMMEYLSVVAAMRLTALASTGYTGGAVKLLKKHNTPTLNDAVKHLKEIAAKEQPDIHCVKKHLRQSIGGIKFRTAMSLMPIQFNMMKGLGDFFSKIDISTTDKQKEKQDLFRLDKISRISPLGGNETQTNRALLPGELLRTCAYRIKSCREASLLKYFADMYMVSNALQVRATVALADNFPTMKDAIKKDINFYAYHAAETIAVCHALEENGIKINNPETLKKLISRPETSQFAHNNYVQTINAYISSNSEKEKFTLIYCDAEKKQMEQIYGNNIPKSSDSVFLPKTISQIEGGKEFLADIKNIVAEQTNSNSSTRLQTTTKTGHIK